MLGILAQARGPVNEAAIRDTIRCADADPRNKQPGGADFPGGGLRPARFAVSREERFESEALPHMRSLYGTAFRMTRSQADAEDLVQETFLRALRSFDRFQAGTNIRAWLFTILHRTRVDALRKLGRTPQTVEMEGEGPAAPPAPESLSASGLEQALQGLPEGLRSAVVLRDVEGFSYREIADILEVPLGTVMSRLHRGRAALRQALGAGR